MDAVGWMGKTTEEQMGAANEETNKRILFPFPESS